MSQNQTLTYHAFLSYSHRDKDAAVRLHRAIERYKVDADLVGRDTPHGPIPASLGPVFRDRSDFSAGPSLQAQTLAALRASKFLIVLCSPDAAASQYVNEEIRQFKLMGGEDRIVPVIVRCGADGDVRESFPPALRCRVTKTGKVTGDELDILATDLRQDFDGAWLGFNKIVAGLMGVRLDEVVRRAERWRRRRQRIWAGIFGLLLLLASTTTVASIYAHRKMTEAEENLGAAIEAGARVVSEAVTLADRVGVSSGDVVELLKKPEAIFNDLVDKGRETPKLRQLQAKMLIVFARNYEKLGIVGDQLDRAQTAVALLTALTVAHPSDRMFQRDLSSALRERGIALQAMGDRKAAKRDFDAALAVATGFTGSGAEENAEVRERAAVHVALGDWHSAAEPPDHAEALRAYKSAHDIFERLATSSDRPDTWRDVSVSHERIGRVYQVQGRFTDALEHFRAAGTITDRLVSSDDRNAQWLRDVSVNRQNIGYIHLLQGQHAEARDFFTEALAIRQQLTRADPLNIGLLADLAKTYERLGASLLAAGSRQEALGPFKAALATYDTMLQRTPDRTEIARASLAPLFSLAVVDSENRCGHFARAAETLDRIGKDRDLTAQEERLLAQARPANSNCDG